MKRVYILTNFSGYQKSYSPIIVVSEQLKMFLQNGYQPTLIASKGWDPPEDSIFNQVETKRLTQVPVSNEAVIDETFQRDVATLFGEMNDIIEDNSVVISHDLIFLPDYVKHNIAARKLAAQRPSITWLHWVHSATSPYSLIKERSMYDEQYVQMLSEKFPNSMVCYPNAYNIPRVARNFGYEEDQVVEVPHTSDITEGMDHLVKRMFIEHKLYEPEFLMVYPLRLDRGKNAEMNVHLIAGLKRMGRAAKLVFCDFQSTGDDKVVYRSDLKRLAKELDVENDVIFISEFDDSATHEVPHKVVLDLFTLSNIFMMPSKSETYSLVTQEAMMRGNFCILNHDFAPFRQIFTEANGIFKPFSANIGFDGYDGEITTTYADIKGFFDDLAKAVIYYTEHEKAIHAKTWVRTQRNQFAIFKKYMEPLLFKDNG